jgi:ribosome-binding protein aMBF1 (putative translation factor)
MPNDVKNKKARSYSSPIIEEMLALEDPAQTARIANRMRLATVIADAMRAKGMNKKALATALKQHPSIITKWLSGKHNFTTDTLTDIGRVLEVKCFAHEVEPLPEVRIQLHFDLYSTAKNHLAPPQSTNYSIFNTNLPTAFS